MHDSGDDTRWQAVQDRDAAADGSFYYAVRTSGVFCRPSCPSRRPRRENVSFFLTTLAAEAAGFRSCLRCRPAQPSARDHVVEQVKALIEANEAIPTLAELGEAVGLSPTHLQRVFKRATGLSPKAYAEVIRAERLKAGLRAGATVTTALYQAGYGSARALYDQAVGQLGMSPGRYRRGGKGERIFYGSVDTPLGCMLVAATERGLCAVRLGVESEMTADLRAEFSRAELIHQPDAVAPYLTSIRARLSGEDSTIALDLHPTEFQRRVWAALVQIPYGQTRSYREVAEMIGQPKAVRAVASACAANPVALVVPCHRVIRTGGEISGYRWGIELKRRLLAAEQAASSDPC